MQGTHLDSNEVIMEYITDAQSNKIKRLKPIFIKSEPDRDHTYHIDSDDDLPAVSEENSTQKREVMVDSYNESISSDDDCSNNITMTTNSDRSAAPDFEETPCKWETDPKGIKTTLHQIATGLQSAAEGYLDLASHVSKISLIRTSSGDHSDSSSPDGCPYAYPESLISGW